MAKFETLFPKKTDNSEDLCLVYEIEKNRSLSVFKIFGTYNIAKEFETLAMIYEAVA